MEFVAAMMPGEADTFDWVRRRQEEGWFGVSLGDHIAPSGLSFPHLWVTLTQFAMASSTLRIVSGFANSLTCSPVSFAQAALTLQAVSRGRFEAGLGAGWAAADSAAHGTAYLEPAQRARHYREAVLVAGELLRTGRCSYHGAFLSVDVADIGVRVTPPPPLVVAVGGPWVIQHVAPLADRVEVTPFASVFRDGRAAGRRWGRGAPEDLAALAQQVRGVHPDAALGMGLFVAAGPPETVAPVVKLFGQGRFAGLAGAPAEVARTLTELEAIGISRITLCELTGGTLEALAEVLYG